MTWVSYESWGWLPYHYGMWALDPELGWYWIPGSLYAPAWVYWSYGDDWTGWCPVGWYGGYYDSYYRSTRLTYGNERGGPWLPNLRGKVEVTQIDRRGWNFAPTSRIGSRLDAPRRDARRPRALPPRDDRRRDAPRRCASNAARARPASVPEAIRRASLSAESARGPGNEGLTSILRRDRVLDAAGREELRRSLAHEPGIRRRAATPDVPRSRERAESWRAEPAPSRREATVHPRATGAPGADEGWRAATTVLPVPVERRGGESRERAGDSGWRAPAPRVIDRSSERPVARGNDAPPRGTTPRRPAARLPRGASRRTPLPHPCTPHRPTRLPAPAPVSAPAPAPAAAPAQAPAAAARER